VVNLRKTVTLAVDHDVYDKFRIALELTRDEEDEALEQCLKWYINKSFERAALTYDPNTKPKKMGETGIEHHGMANRRIPSWAMKPKQFNHRIIKAFLTIEQGGRRVTLAEMERLCSDKSHPKTYVPTFRSNYAQMKLDAPKSHGKVFEDDGETVTIWGGVKDTLMRYREMFLNGDA
jgi:hypothetical protein